jgi:phage-related protein
VWKLIYHDEPGNPSPRGYISGVSASDRANIDHRLNYLRKHPINEWPRAWIEKLEGKIWELRSGAHRILYFLENDTIIVVHALRKRGRKISRNDISLALRRMTYYLDQIAGNRAK